MIHAFCLTLVRDTGENQLSNRCTFMNVESFTQDNYLKSASPTSATFIAYPKHGADD